MDIEILSVNKRDNSYELSQRTDEIRAKLRSMGYNLTYVNNVSLKPGKIKSAVEASVSNPEKPDVIIIANALSTKDSESFRKIFAETVAASERDINESVPKNYWRDRNKAINKAKKSKASKQEINELCEELKLIKKKARVFCLGDFGNGYKGYCFMYKGVKVGVLPQAVLTGADIRDIITLAAARIEDVFDRSAEDYPNGFSEKKYTPEKTGFANRYIPMPGDGFKEASRKCVVIASFLVFAAALSFLAYNMLFLSVKNTELNGEIQRIAHGVVEEDTSSNEVKNKNKKDDDTIDWKKLKKVNDEIVGWIQINKTKIDYPVLNHEGDDRSYQYYLSHNYKGDYDSYGSIFVDYRCKKNVKSKNAILHGHHMNDGSMFGDLLKYGGTTADMDFYKKAPTIKFDTPDGNAVYKIISVFKTNTLSSHGEFFNYMIGDFQNEKDFMNYVYNVRIRSMINCPVDVNEDDTLLTLSTCSYEFTNFRTVVVARKVRKGESTKVDLSQASRNKHPVWPQVYYSVNGGTRPEVTDFCTAYENHEIEWYTGDYDFKDQKIVEATTAPSSKKKNDKNNGSSQQVETQPIVHTVIFINYDGSIIETQSVEDGKSAKTPKNPTKPSDDYYDYVFKGWQLDFNNVKYDMTIAPNFEPVAKAQ